MCLPVLAAIPAFLASSATAIGSTVAGVAGTAAAAGTASTIGTVASVAGTAISAFGAIQQGNAEAEAARTQGQVAAFNAAQTFEAQKREAANLFAQSIIRQRQLGQETTEATAQARASFAAAGVDVTQGTPAAVETEIMRRGIEARFQEKLNAKKIKEGLALQRRNVLEVLGISAFGAEQSARNARISARDRAAGTILSGATQVASGWLRQSG